MQSRLLHAWGIGILFAMGISGCASLAPGKGARPAPAEPSAAGAFVDPLPGSSVISSFGPRRRRMHKGVDLKKSAGGGDIVVAARAGIVEMARRCRGYGLIVDLLHVDGSHTRYAHLRKLLVGRHQQVAAGEPLGIVGATGNATTPHLHFEIRTALGRCVDPSVYLQCCRCDQMVKVQHVDERNEGPSEEAGSEENPAPGAKVRGPTRTGIETASVP